MNEFKQLLVHLDASDPAAGRLRAARGIAAQAGGAVAALYAASPAYVDLAYATDMAPAIVDGLAEIDAERIARAKAGFDAELRTAGPVATWAEASDVPIIDVFARQALHADLLVLGQVDPKAPPAGVPNDFAQAVVMASGKPALIIPHIGWDRPIGDVAAIAWKESRESARAVAASLPLLRRARQVHVLTWGEPAESRVRGEGLDLNRFLRLHGIEAQWHAGGPEPQAIGELLLSRAFDLDADLMVMGCYGHSRARELVLGGASRTVLGSMTLPILMAH